MKPYKSLFEIHEMICRLQGFSEGQIKLIMSIATESYDCGCRVAQQGVNEQKGEK